MIYLKTLQDQIFDALYQVLDYLSFFVLLHYRTDILTVMRSYLDMTLMTKRILSHKILWNSLTTTFCQSWMKTNFVSSMEETDLHKLF